MDLDSSDDEEWFDTVDSWTPVGGEDNGEGKPGYCRRTSKLPLQAFGALSLLQKVVPTSPQDKIEGESASQVCTALSSSSTRFGRVGGNQTARTLLAVESRQSSCLVSCLTNSANEEQPCTEVEPWLGLR